MVINLRDAIHTAIKDERREFVASALKRLRMAYAEGIETLYKFKSLAGDSKSHVRDMIEKSRLYFSKQDQLNDPDDCRPVFKLAGNPADPAFAGELRADEDEMIWESGMTPEEIANLRAKEGTRPEDLAAAVTRNVRDEMARTTVIFCFSATEENAQLWAYYADSHKGVRLHFSVNQSWLSGLARGVDYETPVPPIMVPLRYNPGEHEAARRMSLIKPKGWSHEHEYRILGNLEVDWGHCMDGQWVSFPPEMLTGVTLGLKVSPADRADVLGWALERQPPLPVFETYEDPNTFARMSRQIA